MLLFSFGLQIGKRGAWGGGGGIGGCGEKCNFGGGCSEGVNERESWSRFASPVVLMPERSEQNPFSKMKAGALLVYSCMWFLWELLLIKPSRPQTLRARQREGRRMHAVISI